jgi:hypothetical protein
MNFGEEPFLIELNKRNGLKDKRGKGKINKHGYVYKHYNVETQAR